MVQCQQMVWAFFPRGCFVLRDSLGAAHTFVFVIRRYPTSCPHATPMSVSASHTAQAPSNSHGRGHLHHSPQLAHPHQLCLLTNYTQHKATVSVQSTTLPTAHCWSQLHGQTAVPSTFGLLHRLCFDAAQYSQACNKMAGSNCSAVLLGMNTSQTHLTSRAFGNLNMGNFSLPEAAAHQPFLVWCLEYTTECSEPG